jgi:tetratricopeptide (TPR) repeat protein
MKQPSTPEELRQFDKILRTDPRKYLEIVDEWIARDPQDATALFDRHYAWLALGEPQKALADLDSAIALEPNNPADFFVRGRVHHQLGEYRQAIDDFNRGEAINPQEWQDHAIGLLFQADCHARLGDEITALSCCSRLPDYFWTPGLFGVPRGGRDEIAPQLRQIAQNANKAKDSE